MLVNTKRMGEGGEMKKIKRRAWPEEKAEDGHRPAFV
jgi:hypothetical protein